MLMLILMLTRLGPAELPYGGKACCVGLGSAELPYGGNACCVGAGCFGGLTGTGLCRMNVYKSGRFAFGTAPLLKLGSTCMVPPSGSAFSPGTPTPSAEVEVVGLGRYCDAASEYQCHPRGDPRGGPHDTGLNFGSTGAMDEDAG